MTLTSPCCYKVILWWDPGGLSDLLHVCSMWWWWWRWWRTSAVSWRGEWSWSRLITPSKRDTVRDRLKSGVTVALCAYMRRRHNNKLQNENWKRVHAKSRVIIILRFLLTYCARTSLSFPVKLWINADAKFRSRSKLSRAPALTDVLQ